MTNNTNNLINIHMIDNKGFIWNANDWYTLRTKYRLLGSLIGSLPSAPRQEDQNGLPCYLLPEEVRLLIEKGIGRAVEYPTNFNSLPSEEIDILRSIKESQNIDEIKKKVANYKADFIKKLVVKCILANGDNNCKEVRELNREVAKIKPFDASTLTIIHLEHFYSEVIDVPLPELIVDIERIRYKVFKDLWSKGYYLTCGMKFGGDFLVYEGDPLAYHAKFIVNCSDLDKQIMISRSRVSSITKKKMVLAKEDGGSIKYLIYQPDNTSQIFCKKPINFLID